MLGRGRFLLKGGCFFFRRGSIELGFRYFEVIWESSLRDLGWVVRLRVEFGERLL